jgi:hypothetical protein
MLDVKQLRLLVCLIVLDENPDAKQKDLFPQRQKTLFERKFDELGITPEYPLSIRHVPEFYNNLDVLSEHGLLVEREKKENPYPLPNYVPRKTPTRPAEKKTKVGRFAHYNLSAKGQNLVELLDADWRKWHTLETYLDLLTIPF